VSRDAEQTAGTPDKRALLSTLAIDRDSIAEDRGRPLKWFTLIALAAGIAFAAWFLELPGDSGLVTVRTAVARAASSVPNGASVLDATGYVVARRQATVSSKTTGKVVEVLIEEGVVVVKDQLLARLDDSIPVAQLELAQSRMQAARAGLEEINVQRKQAQLDLDRTQGLAARNLASQADLDRDELSVEALLARLERVRQDIMVSERSVAVQRQIVADMQIRAPFAGIVVAKAAQPGEMISPVSAGGGFTRTGICTIVDMDSLEVEVDVNESYINRVYARQPVQMTLNAYPDHHFPAEVIAIIPTADRNKATVRVRVALLEKDRRVLPDMGVRVAFLHEHADTEAELAATGVIVPDAAIGADDAGKFVYVVDDQRVARRSVTTKPAGGARVRVLSGLDKGERIVTELSDELLLSLADGDRVTVLN
jgi:RND family efflux transporter MFP subunit